MRHFVQWLAGITGGPVTRMCRPLQEHPKLTKIPPNLDLSSPTTKPKPTWQSPNQTHTGHNVYMYYLESQPTSPTQTIKFNSSQSIPSNFTSSYLTSAQPIPFISFIYLKPSFVRVTHPANLDHLGLPLQPIPIQTHCISAHSIPSRPIPARSIPSQLTTSKPGLLHPNPF